MTKQFETLTFDLLDNVATITLNRPDAANSLCDKMGEELVEVSALCDHDPQVKAVILTANGSFFCPGADLQETHALGDETQTGIKRLANNLHAAIAAFCRMQAPIIIAVNGTAAGAGLSMAVFGDYVFAAKRAKFTAAYGNAGLSPDGSLTYFLPRLVGLRKAQDLLLTNRVLSADQAYDMGLVSEVVEDDDLLASAGKLAAKLAKGSLQAHSAVKNLLLSSFDNSLETQMEIEGRTIAACASSANGREGVSAFLEKRKPSFK